MLSNFMESNTLTFFRVDQDCEGEGSIFLKGPHYVKWIQKALFLKKWVWGGKEKQCKLHWLLFLLYEILSSTLHWNCIFHMTLFLKSLILLAMEKCFHMWEVGLTRLREINKTEFCGQLEYKHQVTTSSDLALVTSWLSLALQPPRLCLC